MGKTLLDGGNTLILCFENFNCLLLAFFWVHQKLQLWLNILTTKWYIFVQNKVALIIKNSKDSKNGAKCYHRPLHHSFLSNPLKNLWHRYFNIGASKFFDMYLKFIFSVSPFMWIWNQSWKLTSLCTGLCPLNIHPSMWGKVFGLRTRNRSVNFLNVNSCSQLCLIFWAKYLADLQNISDGSHQGRSMGRIETNEMMRLCFAKTIGEI